jgi:hypothetical protein
LRLIGLYSPNAQSGKSTVASVLNDRGFWTVKFAAPLKDMLRTLYASIGMPAPTIERYIEGDLKENIVPGLGITSRHLMVTLGTNWGRELDPNFWVKAAEAKVVGLHNAYTDVVIDDMRFPNEYRMIKRLGGQVVRITRPILRASSDSVCEGLLDHMTFDREIENSGTLEQLREEAARL